jgi:hypothetical protein
MILKLLIFINKKNSKLFLYDMKLYSLYHKFMIHETINYDVKELVLF